MIRPFIVAVASLTFLQLAMASEPLPLPSVPEAISEVANQPHVSAGLIASTPSVTKAPFKIAVRLKMEPSWHTYWTNPGEAGLATQIKWTLPPGWKAGPIQWPVPEIHAMGPIITYGYDGETYLLVTITPDDASLKAPAKIEANVSWLVCQEECVPGQANVSLELPIQTKSVSKAEQDSLDQFFTSAAARLPLAGPWKGSGVYTTDHLNLKFTPSVDGAPDITGHEVYFFAETPNVVTSHQTGADQLTFSKSQDDPKVARLSVPLEQNGETPSTICGVLEIDPGPNQKVYYIDPFPVSGPPGAKASLPVTPVASTPATPDPTVASSLPDSTTTSSQSSPANWLTIALAAGGAFLGGLILNLMPCVLPVLSLKVYALMRHAHGEGPTRSALPQGLAYTGGVLVSFWILAGLLLILRAAGNQVGWGFQLSSPGFVLFLASLFFILALNLFGVFEVGSSLVGLDVKATQNLNGLASSFSNGALATLAATPCTGPFMGSSIGFAAQQSVGVALLIFTSLALGMASPFLLLTAYPPLLKYMPKPGAWMEAFRQFLGFLLAFTVIYFVYVFGTLSSPDQVPMLLAFLVVIGMGAWIYGRWIQNPISKSKLLPVLGLACIAVACYFQGADLLRPIPVVTTVTASTWEDYSPKKVSDALQEHRPVFVDFTASWCLSCKVNEYVALNIPETKSAFAEKHVLLLRGDWTRNDPVITKTLHQYNRDGVPMYLLYNGKSDQPQILPEVLTPGLVQDAVKSL